MPSEDRMPRARSRDRQSELRGAAAVHTPEGSLLRAVVDTYQQCSPLLQINEDVNGCEKSKVPRDEDEVARA
jgi:hypothetical protein